MIFFIITLLSAGVGLGSALILQLRTERSYRFHPNHPRLVELEPIVASETSLQNR